MLYDVEAFRLRGLAQNEAGEPGREHFAWRLPQNRDVVGCRSAFGAKLGPTLAASILTGINRKILRLYDVEVRFDCANSRKIRPASLAASILRGIYR